MYSIDKQKLKVKDINTGAITSFNPTSKKYKPKNDFDLPNESIYDVKGKLISKATNPKDYDFAFAIKLKQTYPIYKCADLLNYHFHKAVNKELFLKHIEYHILLFPFLQEKQTKKVEFIIAWIKETILLLTSLKQKDTLKNISANNDLSYYKDEKNIPNQELVKETIEYFEKGEGARAFNTLDFLNLLEKQYHFVINNWSNKSIVIDGLTKLPLTGLEKHILFGLLLKWFGGYPITEKMDIDKNINATKKAIEIEFLSYKEDTPEKKFCKADNELRKKMMKLSITGTTSINTGVSWETLYNAIEANEPTKETNYNTFDKLFEAALINQAIGPFENEELKLISRTQYNFNFNVWLQETKGWQYGNETIYNNYLTKDYFLEFLQYEATQNKEQISKMENEANTWQIENNRSTTPPLLWQGFIKIELQGRLQEIENKINDKISNWKLRIDLIECAAFCQLLYDKKYFVTGATSIVSVNKFALNKYGTEITIQLKSAKRKDRNTHKKLLMKFFN
ncbi:hypothetical protein [Ferruginibacter sp.]|nr:hypothetical protein [Ferruginibacter sp.]